MKRILIPCAALGALAMSTASMGKPAATSVSARPLKFDCDGKIKPPAALMKIIEQQELPGADPAACFASANLDGQAPDEIMAMFMGSMYGGSGGNPLYIFVRSGNAWRMIADGTQLTFPDSVIVSPVRSKGFANLSLLGSNGKTVAVRMQYDGQRYK